MKEINNSYYAIFTEEDKEFEVLFSLKNTFKDSEFFIPLEKTKSSLNGNIYYHFVRQMPCYIIVHDDNIVEKVGKILKIDDVLDVLSYTDSYNNKVPQKIDREEIVKFLHSLKRHQEIEELKGSKIIFICGQNTGKIGEVISMDKGQLIVSINDGSKKVIKVSIWDTGVL